MKVVINRCYGGFGLSLIAQEMYAKLKGKQVYFYKWSNKEKKYFKVDNTETGLFLIALTRDFGDSMDEFPNGRFFGLHDILRNDPDLIKVVEELGDKANGKCSNLGIVEIPDDIQYEITSNIVTGKQIGRAHV